MKNVFRLMFDEKKIAEFGTARSGHNAYRLVLAALQAADVDFKRHTLILLSEYKEGN